LNTGYKIANVGGKKKVTIPNAKPESKTYPISEKMVKIDAPFQTKTAQKPYPLGQHIHQLPIW